MNLRNNNKSEYIVIYYNIYIIPPLILNNSDILLRQCAVKHILLPANPNEPWLKYRVSLNIARVHYGLSPRAASNDTVHIQV